MKTRLFFMGLLLSVSLAGCGSKNPCQAADDKAEACGVMPGSESTDQCTGQSECAAECFVADQCTCDDLKNLFMTPGACQDCIAGCRSK